MTKKPNRQKLLIFGFALSSLFTLTVNAQDSTSAHTLVEMWRSKLLPETFDTVLLEVELKDTPTNITIDIDQFFDFRKQLAHSRSVDPISGENHAVYQNGKVNMDVAYKQSPTAEQVEAQARSMGLLLQSQLDEFRIILPSDYQVVSYDGFVQYGGFVKGEQVTLQFKDLWQGGSVVTKSFIFSENGELVATYEPGQKSILAIIDIFKLGDNLRITTTSYTNRTGETVLMNEVTEYYQFNETLESTSFASN